MVKWTCLSLFLTIPVILGSQAGRVRQGETQEQTPPGAVSAVESGPSRPVLVNMGSEDVAACGLSKLTEEELDHLDRWFLQLLVKLRSLPKEQTLTFDPSGQSPAERVASDMQQQQLQAQIRDLQLRMTAIHQEAKRMALDVDQIKLAISRGDLNSIRSSVYGLDSSVRQVDRVSQ